MYLFCNVLFFLFALFKSLCGFPVPLNQFYTSQITRGKVYHSISFLLMSALQCKHLFVKKQKKQNQTQKSEYYLLYNFTFCCKKLNLLTHCHEASITLSDE